MLAAHQSVALFMEGAFGEAHGKMGYGAIRFLPNPIAAVIDSRFAGSSTGDHMNLPRSVPIVASVEEAHAEGATVLVLGIAPSGGRLPEEWKAAIDRAISLGMSLVNGLHEPMSGQYPHLAEGQWVWDIRVEPEGLGPGQGRTATLSNRRLLMVGTDMAIGKMTAGLEIMSDAKNRGVKASFVATGQIGILLTGGGIPLDAIRVDYACGAVENEVLKHADSELVVVEGQGSLVHPGSTSNLPLLRGTMPTHIVLCHRMGQTHLMRVEHVAIPPLPDLIRLYEAVANCCGSFPAAKVIGIALNSSECSDDAAALAECERISAETGLPCVDPIRHGSARLVDAVMA